MKTGAFLPFINQEWQNVKGNNRNLFAKWLPALLIICSVAQAATTGKIAGRVTDRESGQPLVGANIMIRDTRYGVAADDRGDYYIINIPPGQYDIVVSMIGYGPVQMEKVLVSANATVNLNFQLSAQVLEGEVVTVQADAIAFKKDQTSSVQHVSSSQIGMLPVENLGDIIQMQAGVMEGHFRGGRANEVSYMVDGLPVTDAFEGERRTVDIENDVIEDLEVITGTFNAEYGRAMSGIVNAVTKDGGNQVHGKILGFAGNYYTTRSSQYLGLKAGDVLRNKDVRIQVEGPVFKDALSFFANVRYQDNQNHLNAIRRFNMDDYSDYTVEDPAQWIDTHNGDSAFVSLNGSENLSAFGKLTWRPAPPLKLSFVYSRNQDEWGTYSHFYKYAPDGKARQHETNDMTALHVNHSLTKNMFYEFKVSYTDNAYGSYLYENPLDTHYLHDRYANSFGPGFLTGGQDKNHLKRTNRDLQVKWDHTWQVNSNHSLKTGVHYIRYDIDNQSYAIQNKYKNDTHEYDNYFDAERNTFVYPYYEPKIYGDSSVYSDVYRVKPREISGYMQDKMEFQEMVINVGLRYDQYDPNTRYPSDLRNPANQLYYADSLNQTSRYPAADVKSQFSPRFGLSYQLSDAALLHFSYGHFFQAPPFYAFYQNHSFQVAPTDYSTQTGNPQLKAQKTVQYEIGIWQELMTGMGLELNLFYRDIYDLLSMKVVSTYNQIQYGLYTNKDYGNVKGLEVKYDFRTGPLSALVNYTLQFTRGNADNPTQTFDRAGSSRDPIPRLIPMSWDQRHTLNATLGYASRNGSLSMTAYYNSGKPYTWSPIQESRLARVNLYPNNSWQPTTFWIDLHGTYDYELSGRFKLRFSLLVENLLDRRNALYVNGETGQPNEAIIRESDLASHRSLFNEYADRIKDPAAFAAPRYIKLGVGLLF